MIKPELENEDAYFCPPSSGQKDLEHRSTATKKNELALSEKEDAKLEFFTLSGADPNPTSLYHEAKRRNIQRQNAREPERH